MKWNTEVTNLSKMFKGLKNILEVDLSKFDSTKVRAMNEMFNGCDNIQKIDFTNFKTSNMISWYSLFYNCKSLLSLDLSSFQTNKVKNFGSMLLGCQLLTSVDLTSFDASSMTHMDNMFKNCFKLTSLNLRSFKTIKAEKIFGIFYNCKSLVYLDISNFDTSKLTTGVNDMFYGCLNLKYLNLINVTEKESFNYNNIFSGIPENIIVCINKDKSPKLYEQKKKKKYLIYDCLDNINDKHINALIKSDSCMTYHFSLGNNNPYENCTQNFFTNNISNSNNLTDINCFYKIGKCLTCSFESLINNNLCISCNNKEGFYEKEKDDKNIGIYHNCYSKQEMNKFYYFDDNNLLFMPCYDSCETCDRIGNKSYHYCLSCKLNFIEMNKEYYFLLTNNITIFKNCYEKCPFYYFIDINKNKSYCTEYPKCLDNYNKFIVAKNECVSNCSNDIDNPYEFRKECFNECSQGSMLYINKSYINPLKNIDKNYYCEVICDEKNPFEIISKQECVNNCSINDLLTKSCLLKYETKNNSEENNIAQKTFLDSIENSFTSGNYNTSNLDEGNDDLIRLNNIVITLSTLENQKSKENKSNYTSINLNKCEELIRKEYNISENKTIYIKKFDTEQEDFSIPKINFDIYSKIFDNNLTKLNLSVCKNIKIDFTLPIEINEPIDKLNLSSGYFNDICYPAKSNKGTDIIMKDRKNEFIENNKAICQEDCDFSYYHYNMKKAKCSCEVKTDSFSFSLENMKINKTKLYQNIVNIENIANVNILICYRQLFNKKSLLKNFGFFMIITIIIFHFILMIIFYVNQLKIIKNNINDISFAIKNWKLVVGEEKKLKKNNNIITSKKSRNNTKKMKTNLLNKKKKKKEKSKCIKISPIDINNINNIIDNPPKKIKKKKKLS